MTAVDVQPDADRQTANVSDRRANLKAAYSRLSHSHWPFVILMALAFLVGLLVVRDYGMSTDEFGNATVGKEALEAYAGSTDYFSLGSLKDHGPAYFMLFSATSEAINRLFPGWLLADGRHLTNYASFLAGVAFFYLISLRIMRRSSALLASALFASQPMIFGSAFINQKDIPFLGLFLGVVALGILTADHSHETADPDRPGFTDNRGPTLKGLWEKLAGEWGLLDRRRRLAIQVGFSCAVVVTLDLFFFGLIRRTGEALVSSAYDGRALAPIQMLFSVIATDAYKTTLPEYLIRLEEIYTVARVGLVILFGVIGMVALARALPSFEALLKGPPWRLRLPALLAGAVLLGCTISVRQIGLLAGGLVSMYLLYRGRARAIGPLFLYWIVAAAVTYVTWPYLWPDPIGNFELSLGIIPEFGAHSVLFRGQDLTSATIPWEYVPTLLAVDLTESTLALAVVGITGTIWRLVNRKIDRGVVGLLAVWFILPIGWQISQHVPLYNNIRHFLFVFPPLLFLTGIGFEVLASRLRRPFWKNALIILIFIPGILGIVTLHPYEYSYFNSLVGGVSGAAGNYDLDYWCTSLKEGVEAVDELAPYADTVQIFGPLESVQPYARVDLQLINRRERAIEADMVVVCVHRFGRRWGTDGYHIVYQVKRGNAVFAEVWQRDQTDALSSSRP
jgi:hypothetical protein